MIPVDAAILLVLILATPAVAALLLLLAAAHKLARKYGHRPADAIAWYEKKPLLWIAGVYLSLYALCFAYGMFIEADWVVLTRTELRVERPVLGHDRFRIVHLSDLHLERFGRRERRLVELVRQARPHLILLTGDYLNVREGGAALDELLRALVQMAPPFGVFGVDGNWDAKFITRDLFRRAGATLLDDETRLIQSGEHRLRLVGHSVFPSMPLCELLRGIRDDAYTIYLHHMPDAVDEFVGLEPGQRVHLFLCGHTHGGQVRLPFWGAVVTLSKFHKQYEMGLYDVGGVPMYVNRGVGMEGGAAPRVRFLAPPEVALIELVPR